MANDGGEMCQIAISLTCPKTPIVIDGFTATGDHDFSESPVTTTIEQKQVEISQAEQESLADLLAKFGL
jgi:hypothetical protein